MMFLFRVSADNMIKELCLIAHFVNSAYFLLLLNLSAVWDYKIIMAMVFTGAGHVKSVMVELLLSESFPLDTFVI